MPNREQDSKLRSDPPVRARPRSTVEESEANPLSDLQQKAGNQAVAALVERATSRMPSGTGKFSRLLSGVDDSPSSPGLRPAQDAAAEAHADRVADATVSHLGPRASAPPVVGGVLHPSVRAAMAAVQPGVGGLGQVRFRTDDHAAGQAEGIGARAFSRGGEVSVGRGELGRGVESTRLAAHEAAHAVSHAAPSGMVHAKLRGVRSALENQGGGTTSGSVRKFFGVLTNWDKILTSVAAYEEMEEAFLAKGKPSKVEVGQVAPRFLEQLMKIRNNCASWMASNGGERQAGWGDKVARSRKQAQENPDLENPWKDPSADARSKPGRRQAIAQLVTRVETEIADLESGRWGDTLGLSDKQVSKEGREDKGQKSSVKELHYVTENGEFSGYFKAEKGFNDAPEPHELDSGIRQVDPNLGARAIASYRLDQLFGAGVTARAEWAVRNGVMGTVLESANGVAFSDMLRAGSHEASMQPGRTATDVDDPVLQQGLNKLQLMDVICGQLDRHQANYRINLDKQGKVTGVTGIDLDMSFGSDLSSAKEMDKMKGAAPNWAGMPELIDAEFAERILQVSESDVRLALKGLLNESEIGATVMRFQAVKQIVSEIPKEKLVTKWGVTTANAQRGYAKRWGFEGANSYAGQVLDSHVIAAYSDVHDQLTSINREPPTIPGPPLSVETHSYLAGLPSFTTRVYGKVMVELMRSDVTTYVQNGSVNPEDAMDFGMSLIDELLSDDHLRALCEITCQENADLTAAATAVGKLLAPRYKDIFRNVLLAHGHGRVLAGID
ncbi:MAG TPA: DUF4157 domain-containing protein [Acidimicrobiales bacterium]|nr:DUF4157 domain-containing protein [Acidimicrobiales bacterium]